MLLLLKALPLLRALLLTRAKGSEENGFEPERLLQMHWLAAEASQKQQEHKQTSHTTPAISSCC